MKPTLLLMVSVALLAGCATPKSANSQRMRALSAPPLPAASATVEQATPANYLMKLSWTENDPVQLVTSYSLYSAPIGGEITKKTIWTAPPIELVRFLETEPNGIYRLELTAVNSAGLESERSAPFWVFWYARPEAPTNLVVEFIPPSPQ